MPNAWPETETSLPIDFDDMNPFYTEYETLLHSIATSTDGLTFTI